MVDMMASNLKLEQRSRNMLRRLSTKCSFMRDSELDALLSTSKQSVKLAILVAETSQSVETCEKLLESAGGVLATALSEMFVPTPTQSATQEISRRFVLCVDGGGTKCASAVASADRVVSHGYGGPCNLYVQSS
jgi:N-acetylmuramic acid 6-phosphate etherase